MKKRVLALILSMLLMVLALTGCGSTEAESAETSPSTSSEESNYKIAMVLNSSVSDGGWGSSCYQAMVDAAEELGWESAVTDNLETADYASVMMNYASMGYNLIFAPGNEYSDAVAQVAGDYPNVYFCLLNGTIETDNITSVLPDAQQIGYMAGALAGLMSETNYIGFIGGMELDTTKQKLESYTVGAQKVNSAIKVQSAYAGSFSDAAKGKEIADYMVSSNGVDVIFGDASAVDTGAREALANYEKSYSIGQPGDLGSVGDQIIINSVVTDNSALVKECMTDVLNGTYGNKTIKGNLTNGCLTVGTFSNVVPEDIQAEYLEIVEKIKAGTF